MQEAEEPKSSRGTPSAVTAAQSGTSEIEQWIARVAAEVDRRRSEAETFVGFEGLASRVPYSPRTLRELIHKGIIPAIRPPGARKFLFHLPSVTSSLLRFQRGGIE